MLFVCCVGLEEDVKLSVAAPYMFELYMDDMTWCVYEVYDVYGDMLAALLVHAYGEWHVVLVLLVLLPNKACW